MINITATLILLIGLVITQHEIEESIPIGSPAEDAVVYLQSIGGEPRYYESSEQDALKVPSYPWLDSDVGYYRAYLTNVRPHWWSIPRGRFWRVWVGVSTNGSVSQVIIRGGRSAIF